ncbi:hypothetical protein LINPERHAP1_LOCUS24093 [Linum perenne]
MRNPRSSIESSEKVILMASTLVIVVGFVLDLIALSVVVAAEEKHHVELKQGSLQADVNNETNGFVCMTRI